MMAKDGGSQNAGRFVHARFPVSFRDDLSWAVKGGINASHPTNTHLAILISPLVLVLLVVRRI